MSKSPSLARRRFLQSLPFCVIGAKTALSGASPQTSLRVGAPIYGELEDPEEIARRHVELGYRAAYAPDVDINDTPRIRAMERAFAEHDVVIAEVGAWVNMLDPDPVKRRENLEYVETRLALADELGARCCVDIAGSYNPDVWYGPHPRNLSEEFFEATVENCRRLIDSVRPSRTKFSIEMMGWALPTTPDQYVRLVEAVDRPAFGVHVDVCNMINSPEKMYRSTDLIRECFQKLGQWIVSCHAKDVAWNPGLQVHFEEVIPGEGVLDYGVYLEEVARLDRDVPLMLEHLKTPEEYRQAFRHLQSAGRPVGIEI